MVHFMRSLKIKVRDLLGVDPRSLALFRICISFFTIVDLIIRATSLKAHYTDFGLLPRAPLIEQFASVWRFSFHFMSGEAPVQAILFLINGILAFMLLMGYHTRLANFGCWLFMVSLHARNPMILQGGDILFRLGLFWGLFLPLGERFSVDRMLSPKIDLKPKPVVSIASGAFLLQIAFMYWFSVASKLSPTSRPVWWNQGLAVYHALRLDQFTLPFGYFLLHFPLLLKFINYMVLATETLAPLFLLSPFFTPHLRTVAVFLLVGLHFGMGLAMQLGPFTCIAPTCLLALLPGWFWEKLGQRVSGETKKATQIPKVITGFKQWWRSSAAFRTFRWVVFLSSQVAVLFLLVYVFFWNLGAVRSKLLIPREWEWLGFMLGIDQQWNMFSPPSQENGWYVIPGKLRNGTVIDIFQDGKPVSWEKPPRISGLYRYERWRKYLDNLYAAVHMPYRLYYGRYLCRDWNSRHSEQEQLEEFEIFFVLEPVILNQSTVPQKISLWKHYCFKVPDDVKG